MRISILITETGLSEASYPEANYDESRVPAYTLPDPLTCLDGRKVTDASTWRGHRRPEILSLFEEQVYGRAPRWDGATTAETLEVIPILNGKAERRQIRLHFARGGKECALLLLVYTPIKGDRPAPIFIGLNFKGNHTIEADPAIIQTPEAYHDAARGSQQARWPLAQILARGYGVATAHCCDLAHDDDSALRRGIHPLFYTGEQERPQDDEWGAIAAWSWGLRRMLDFFGADPTVDAQRVCVLGHSRLGKAALWAGAVDKRFAIVISNDSGCAGAALSRRRFGETVAAINRRFPHWLCRNFHQYDSAEEKLPIDQHMLLALVAPRPLYVASAEDDGWADPRGEFLGAAHARPVYKLLDRDVFTEDEMPAVGEPLQSTIGYHIRAGAHAITPVDWAHFLDFADRHFGNA